MGKPKLSIELIPKTAWFENLRKHLTSSAWEKVKRTCFTRAGYCCEICGGKGGAGKKHPVECHERWKFDRENYTIKLVGIIALCPACHEVKHIGLAQALGNFDRAIKHFCRVNSCSKDKAFKYVERKMARWQQDSRVEFWKLDVTYLKEYLKSNMTEETRSGLSKINIH